MSLCKKCAKELYGDEYAEYCENRSEWRNGIFIFLTTFAAIFALMAGGAVLIFVANWSYFTFSGK